jgi:hypothetical protein
MPNYKVVYVYAAPISKGFTEVYYRTAASLAAAASFDQTSIVKALAPRNPLTVLRKIRVSDTANNRTAIQIPINQNNKLNVPSSPDVVGTTAVLTLASTQTGATRRLWMRGLSDVDVLRDPNTGADTPSPGLLTAITNWIAVVANNFTIRSLTQLGTAPNIYQTITSVSGIVNAGLCTITFTGTSPYVAGQQIIITRMSPKLFPGINGRWTPTFVDANHFTIPYNLDQSPPLATLTGKWRPAIYQYGTIDASVSNFLAFGTRDTGQGFLTGRGRKRAVHLRSL